MASDPGVVRAVLFDIDGTLLQRASVEHGRALREAAGEVHRVTLDGVVDFNDLVRLAQNYNVADGQRTWFAGDFTYDGTTDFNDLVKLAQNYNTALPGGANLPGAPAAFQADLAAALASVPEPASVAALAAFAACGLARKG